MWVAYLAGVVAGVPRGTIRIFQSWSPTPPSARRRSPPTREDLYR